MAEPTDKAIPGDSLQIFRETFPVGPLQCNCTVLGDVVSGEAMVVDPGGDITKILAVLSRNGLHLKSIVVTHAHLDHIAGAATLRDLTGAPVLYHTADLALVAVMDQQAAWMGVPVPEVKPPDQDLQANSSLQLGPQRVDVLHTPGHTPGSICLYLPQSELLLAGDTLFRGGVGRTDLWGGDTTQLLRSLQRELLHLPEGTLVIAGHGPSTSIGFEKEHNQYMQNV